MQKDAPKVGDIFFVSGEWYLYAFFCVLGVLEKNLYLFVFEGYSEMQKDAPKRGHLFCFW